MPSVAETLLPLLQCCSVSALCGCRASSLSHSMADISCWCAIPYHLVAVGSLMKENYLWCAQERCQLKSEAVNWKGCSCAFPKGPGLIVVRGLQQQTLCMKSSAIFNCLRNFPLFLSCVCPLCELFMFYRGPISAVHLSARSPWLSLSWAIWSGMVANVFSLRNWISRKNVHWQEHLAAEAPGSHCVVTTWPETSGLCFALSHAPNQPLAWLKMWMPVPANFTARLSGICLVRFLSVCVMFFFFVFYFFLLSFNCCFFHSCDGDEWKFTLDRRGNGNCKERWVGLWWRYEWVAMCCHKSSAFSSPYFHAICSVHVRHTMIQKYKTYAT